MEMYIDFVDWAGNEKRGLVKRKLVKRGLVKRRLVKRRLVKRKLVQRRLRFFKIFSAFVNRIKLNCNRLFKK